MNEYYTETTIHALEQQILSLLKIRQEEYPSEKHDAAWLEYSNFIMKRRGYYDNYFDNYFTLPEIK